MFLEEGLTKRFPAMDFWWGWCFCHLSFVESYIRLALAIWMEKIERQILLLFHVLCEKEDSGDSERMFQKNLKILKLKKWTKENVSLRKSLKDVIKKEWLFSLLYRIRHRCFSS